MRFEVKHIKFKGRLKPCKRCNVPFYYGELTVIQRWERTNKRYCSECGKKIIMDLVDEYGGALKELNAAMKKEKQK